LYSNERLSVFRLLNCETAGATIGLLFRHIAQYRTEPVTNPEVRAALTFGENADLKGAPLLAACGETLAPGTSA
jgi:hypothetical protein